jgi:uncharacterized membrane protein
MAMMSWMLAVLLLGFATGLRSMTPMAVLCWFSYLGYLPVGDTWASWTGGRIAVAIFSAMAIGELIADKLPWIPNRTAPGPLIARIILGGLVGSIAATAGRGPSLEGVLLGVAGAIPGAFTGFLIRRRIVKTLGCPDWPIGVAEDALTLTCVVLSLHMITS